MSKKIPLGITLALILVSIALTVAVTVGVYMNVYNKLIRDIPQRSQVYSRLSDMEELVRSNYYGTPDSSVIDAHIAKGYIEGLNDEYSVYLTAEEFENYNNLILGNISGIGLETEFDSEEEKLIVIGIAEDSPAQLAGIELYDEIQTIEHEEVTYDNYQKLTALFDSEKLKNIEINLLRPATDDNEEKAYSVTLDKGYKLRSCFSSTIGTVGYIRLSGFYENTAQIFADEISSFDEKGVTGIIIDVRNNFSNNLEAAAKVIDVIVPLATEGTGELATAKNSSGETVEVFSSDSSSVNLPIAVLINDRTEGAAELLACDLRDFGKAKLFGEKTAGHGTMQNIFRTDDGGAVLLTVAKIYPYLSDSYDGTGVEPDEYIHMNESEKNKLFSQELNGDEQYQAALNYFS